MVSWMIGSVRGNPAAAGQDAPMSLEPCSLGGVHVGGPKSAVPYRSLAALRVIQQAGAVDVDVAGPLGVAARASQ